LPVNFLHSPFPPDFSFLRCEPGHR
jgi:hypothetical protein